MTPLFSWLTRHSTAGATHSSKPDTYAGFEQLAHVEREGETWRVVSRAGGTSFAVVAPHGGGIEPGTSELAHAIAGADHALYVFEGLMWRGNERLHVTSTRFDEPRLAVIAKQVDVLIAMHGERGDGRNVYLGGLHEELRGRMERQLREEGFEVGVHPLLAGLEPANLCNRGRSARGVQLELSAGLRRSMFASLGRRGRASPTAVFDRFVAAVRAGLG